MAKTIQKLTSTTTENLLKDTTKGFKWNSISIFNMAFIKIIRGFLIPKILPTVAEYGLFSSINVFTRYLNFSDFGAKEYLMKNLPHVHLNEPYAEEKRLINETINFILLSFLLVIMYLSIYALIYKGENADFYKLSLLLLIPITMFARGKDILIAIANSRQEYSTVAKTQIYLDLISLVLTVLGVYYYGAIGGVYALLITHIIIYFIVYRTVQVEFELKMDFKVLKNLKKYWRLFSVYLVENLNNTIDLIFILAIFSSEDFGLYSLGTVFAWVIIAISGMFITSLNPKIMSFIKVGRENLDKIVHVTQFTFLLFCLFVIPFLVFGIYILINGYLIKFRPGLDIYFLLIISGLLRSSTIILKQMYIAKNSEVKYIKLMIMGVILSSAFYFGFNLFNGDIHQLIYLVIAVDSIVFLLLYVPLYSKKMHNLFVSNIALILGAFIFTMVIKHNFQNTPFDFGPDFLKWLLISVAPLLIIGTIAYFKRNSIVELIKS
jgi:O-antigen/teichoic acid export membrane protein